MSELTPETWHMAMVDALQNYRNELERWVADRSDKNLRRLNLAGDHVDAINAERPERSVDPQALCGCGRPLSPGLCSVCDNDE